MRHLPPIVCVIALLAFSSGPAPGQQPQWLFSTDLGSDLDESSNLNASDLTFTVDDGTDFAVRQTLLIGTEQLGPITAISTNDVTVAERGLNGTTAAAHDDNADIYIWQVPYDVEQIATRLAVWLYRQADAPFEKTAMPSLGQVVIPAKLPEDLQAALLRLRKVDV